MSFSYPQPNNNNNNDPNKAVAFGGARKNSPNRRWLQCCHMNAPVDCVSLPVASRFLVYSDSSCTHGYQMAIYYPFHSRASDVIFIDSK